MHYFVYWTTTYSYENSSGFREFDDKESAVNFIKDQRETYEGNISCTIVEGEEISEN
jgi:hypothetical protein